MSQILSQVPRHLLQQQQRLTPQLIQAMDILQLNAMALEARISQEIDDNPALELVPMDDEAAGDGAPEQAEPEERPEGEQAMVVAEGDAQDFERLDRLVTEYDFFEEDREYGGTKSRARVSEEGDMKMEAMANTIARPISLQDYLLDQWSMVELDDETRRIGVAIIENVDDVGRLPAALDEIASRINPAPTLAQMKDALARVQQLDPPGVATRSLQECLLLQLEALPGDTELERRTIEDHFDDLQKNRLPVVAKALGIDMEEFKGVLHVISRLSIHPGIDVVDRSAPPVVPDILVEYNEDEDRYKVSLTRSGQRELRISPEFREALERARGDRRAREFIKQKLETASAIIDAIKFRSERLLEVAQAVVEAQRDFLDHGEQHLKVLRMSDLAARFGCDPSTISRTVDDKWMQTPLGIFPLRQFFTGGTDSGNGDALGWGSIKAKVQEIVNNENKADPLSDDEIVSQLKSQGIEIKRRTVAKYRSQLGIPTARQRRQY